LWLELYQIYKEHWETVKRWISQLQSNRILDNIQKLQTVMSIGIFDQSYVNDSAASVMKLLDIYNEGNQLKPEFERVNYTEFYNDGVNKEIDLKTEYEAWIRGLNY